jgi:hypothetical protein
MSNHETYDFHTTSTPKKLEDSCDVSLINADTSMKENNSNKNSLNDLLEKDAALSPTFLDDSCFDLADFQAIDEIITQTQLKTQSRKSMAIESPLSSKKIYKKPKISSTKRLPTNCDEAQKKFNSQVLETSIITALEKHLNEKESQPVTSNLQSILLSNAQKSTVLKPSSSGRRMLNFQPAEISLDKSSKSLSKSLSDSFKDESFFGLPLEVKQLIEDFKDIKSLYSRFLINYI